MPGQASPAVHDSAAVGTASGFSPTARRWLYVFLALLFLGVWLSGLEYRKLIKTDEGRYAEISREMVVTGDWLTPRLNGIKYFEKPPLHYWATATAYSMFGVHQWTARLWVALCGLFGIAAVWLLARRLNGEPAGMLAALALASSLHFFTMAHMNTLDMGLAAFMTLALAGFVRAQMARSDLAVTRWMALSWFATALAVLSKGPVAIVLPGATMVIYSLVTRDLSVWKRLRPGLGLLILAVVAAPWFVWISIVNPEFPWFFFVHEHLSRFLTKVHRREEPWWYFFPLLIAGILPWTLSAIPAVIRAWRRQSGEGFEPGRFLIVYAAIVFAFFSASGSKLPSYILPVFPALAVPLGAYLSQVRARTFGLQLVPIAALAAAMVVLAPTLASRDSGGGEFEAIYRQFGHWLQASGAVLLASIVIAWFLCARRRVRWAVIALASGMLITLQLVTVGYDALHPSSSSYQIASEIKPRVGPDTPFFSVRIYEQALPFYLGRTVTLVEYKDEFEYGLEQEPLLAIQDFAEFSRRWRTDPEAYALMSRPTYDELHVTGLPMKIIASDPKRVIVRNK